MDEEEKLAADLEEEEKAAAEAKRLEEEEVNQLFVDLGLMTCYNLHRQLHKYMAGDDNGAPRYDNGSRLSGTGRYVYRALAVDREFRVVKLDDNETYFSRHGSLYKNGEWRLFRMRRRHGEWRTEPFASKLLGRTDPRLRSGWVRHDQLAYDLLCAARLAADHIAADPVDSTFEIVQSATRRYFVRKSPDPGGQCDFHSFDTDGSVGQWCFSASLDKCHVKRKRSMVGVTGRCQLEHARAAARKRKKTE
jgi:hypothetical protein